ncbi:sentrin-specific protease 1-like [Olea europaea subsp. europaea]|uniref:Sentrin-specific protease 1-like n=1 Tax=Olea europaea subsp. europaea TaxID=158383 RepID=A0A8S0R074_OLEEU|nr:sentrin-specific protease 1-like [Olea europaea subsp. europaea]
MPNLDLVEALPDDDVVMFRALYFLTAYLFPCGYNKVVDHFLFVLVKDFIEMKNFPWGKLLFQITLGALRDGLRRRTLHYRINWMAYEQPSAAKLEGPDCFSNPKIEICDLEPLESEMAHSSDDDDEFVAPPPKWQEPSTRLKSPVVKGPSIAHHSQEKPQSHGAQWDDAIQKLRVQVSKLQANNKMLKAELDDIKSKMSSLNEGKTNKMDDIVQMQACIKSDLMDIRTNMQFLSKSMSAMISSAMDEIIRWSGERTNERGVGQIETSGDGNQEHHVVGGSDKVQKVENVLSNVDKKEKGKRDLSDNLPFSFEPPSFDLGIEYTLPNVLHSEEIQKRIDSRSDVVTETKIVENEGSPTAEPTSELPVKRVLRWGINQKTRKSLARKTNAIKPAFLIGSFPVGHKTWFHELINSESSLSGAVLQGIESYMKVLSALMNALKISKTDPDYHVSKAKELKVIIDDTLPQQTNGHDCRIFVVLYVLYLIRGGRCSIPHKFDVSKFRMDIAILLYKHRQVYTKRVDQLMTGKALVKELKLDLIC